MLTPPPESSSSNISRRYRCQTYKTQNTPVSIHSSTFTHSRIHSLSTGTYIYICTSTHNIYTKTKISTCTYTLTHPYMHVLEYTAPDTADTQQTHSRHSWAKRVQPLTLITTVFSGRFPDGMGRIFFSFFFLSVLSPGDALFDSPPPPPPPIAA